MYRVNPDVCRHRTAKLGSCIGHGNPFSTSSCPRLRCHNAPGAASHPGPQTALPGIYLAEQAQASDFLFFFRVFVFWSLCLVCLAFSIEPAGDISDSPLPLSVGVFDHVFCYCLARLFLSHFWHFFFVLLPFFVNTSREPSVNSLPEPIPNFCY